MESRCSSQSEFSVDNFNWQQRRQKLFIYWCFAHFIQGMIHSIRYSSQYLYFKDVMKVANPDVLYGLSVSFIGATGVIFPLVISPIIDRTRSIKKAVLVINILGLFGNLLYALPFSPALPLIGQLLAGTTPAFSVIAMGEISRAYTSEKLTKRISALSLIYSVGTFTSIGLVFTFLYVNFNIGAWNINFANMPGLFLTIAFLFSAILSQILVSDVSKEFDIKLEERIKRSSCASTPSSLSSPPPTVSSEGEHSNMSTPALSEEFIPQIIEPIDEASVVGVDDEDFQQVVRDVGEPFYFNVNNNNNHPDNNNTETEDGVKDGSKYLFPPFKANGYSKVSQADTESTTSTSRRAEVKKAAKITVQSIWKILRYRTTFLLMAITFLEAFIYSIIVTSLPVLATKLLGWGKVELALLSMINKFLSVIVSGIVFFLTDHLEDFLLLIYGTFSSLLALLSLAVLQWVETNTVATTIMFFVIASFAISGVPMIITSTRSMLAKMVPTEIQSLTEAVRMSVFEASFVPAGFLVPVVILNVPVTAIFLFLVLLGVILFAVNDMQTLVELKEIDEYWQDIEQHSTN